MFDTFEAKVGNITDEIVESLEKTPEIFHFKSKGLLLAAHVCEALDRKRYRLEFEDPDIPDPPERQSLSLTKLVLCSAPVRGPAKA